MRSKVLLTFRLLIVMAIVHDVAPSVCVKSGLMCSDCDHQALCIENGRGSFIQAKNICPEGSHCINSSCVAGAKCNLREFRCTADGNFPDPYDCTAYHICSLNTLTDEFDDVPKTCGPGRGSYDSATASCGFPLTTDACIERPVPACIGAMQMGVTKYNPSVYYICIDDGVELGPELYRCYGGKVYDPTTISCIQPLSK